MKETAHVSVRIAERCRPRLSLLAVIQPGRLCAGPVGAIAVALFAGAVALILGQVAFATIRSPTIRLAIGALYALPAGLAGFHAVKGLSETGGTGEAWTLIFASIGAIIVGATAWVRIASLAGPETQSGGVDSHHAGYAARDG
jgi:hypothetical protein